MRAPVNAGARPSNTSHDDESIRAPRSVRVSPAKVAAGARRGSIVPVGGAEDKLGDTAILKRVLDLSGGRRARIAIVPTASRADDTGRRYEALFKELGAASATVVDIETRAHAEDPATLAALSEADGIWLTGGNQLRLSTVLGGTSVARLLRQRNAQGATIAGTSAGAAFLCEHMIAFGEEGTSPRAGQVTLAPGLGLTNRVIIDQHFRQRDRLGRLLTALSYNPFPVGFGLDEDTAAVIHADNTVEVVGSGAITVVDTSEVGFTSMDLAAEHDPVCLIGIRLHILVQGARFDLNARVATPGSVAVGKG